jgi:hypothetical protein
MWEDGRQRNEPALSAWLRFGDAMPAYRIYWFDQDDHVIEADHLIAEADDDVRAGAVSHLGMASAVEVWHQARRVVRVSADKPAT